jgi:hypothetical protein
MRNPWRRKRGEQAKETPAVALGVVHPSGAAGAQYPPEKEWTLRFALKPWRQAGGELDERELSISKPVPEKSLREYMRLIQPYDVVRAKVRFSDELTATLLEFLGKDDSDEDLAERAAELQQPVTMEVDSFGTLTLDRRVGWWETEQAWTGMSVRLSVSPDEDGKVDAAVKTAQTLWRNQSEWDERLRARAIDDLLTLKNENWREESEAEVTPQEFARRMKPESVTVQPNGEFDFWFEDGDLFLGHGVSVAGSLAEGPTEAEIAG